jgi:hypothetical protein
VAEKSADPSGKAQVIESVEKTERTKKLPPTNKSGRSAGNQSWLLATGG